VLGHKIEGQDLDIVYENFLIMADEKKQVNDQDLEVLAVNIPVLAR
jgi:2-isopropylmalate synthase